jgi:hypothetical protein
MIYIFVAQRPKRLWGSGLKCEFFDHFYVIAGGGKEAKEDHALAPEEGP